MRAVVAPDELNFATFPKARDPLHDIVIVEHDQPDGTFGSTPSRLMPMPRNLISESRPAREREGAHRAY